MLLRRCVLFLLFQMFPQSSLLLPSHIVYIEVRRGWFEGILLMLEFILHSLKFSQAINIYFIS